MVWCSDFDFEDYGKPGDGVVAILECPCGATAEFYLGVKDEKET